MYKSIKRHIKAAKRNLQYSRDLVLEMLRRVDVKKPLTRYSEKGTISPNYDKPLCLFCSYAKENVLRDSVSYYLNALVLAGFDVIFISSSDFISEADLQKLSGSCIRIINRENKGYDFYGWKTGLEEYPQFNTHLGLLLVNDSVLGPLFSINDIVTKLENCPADIVGMTNSFRYHPHLQSYFLYCKKNVLLSEEFIRFFSEIKVMVIKNAVIRKYEVGFSKLLSRRFRMKSLYDLERVIIKSGYNEKSLKWIEPTFDMWKPLITEFKFPFLKKSVFLRKGVGIDEISAMLAKTDSSYKLEP